MVETGNESPTEMRKSMIIKNGSFDGMAHEVKKKNLRIVIFGAGMMGLVTAPEILKQYGIEESVECYVDNDSRCWNSETDVFKTAKKILSPEVLKNYDAGKTVILLAISRCHQVLQQLEMYENLQKASCYILPMMCITNFKNTKYRGAVKESSYQKIPKVIHYMWLGKKEMPEKWKVCIDSWKTYCPDYEIQRWDESNYDIHKNQYMSQAYHAGMYGFVPDYARLDILYQYGGIYMDTDVQLIKNLDDMLYQDAFCGVEKWQTLNFGGLSGSVKGSNAIEKMLEERERLSFFNTDGSKNMNTCGYFDTLTAMKYGYRITGKNQKILDMNIYSYDYFHPYDYMSGQLAKTLNTYSIHHFNGGWLDETMREENEKIEKEYENLFALASKNM